eukprot:COSAG01_NODE_40388_length_464_cov_1.082192_1_plen_40_part_10
MIGGSSIVPESAPSERMVRAGPSQANLGGHTMQRAVQLYV